MRYNLKNIKQEFKEKGIFYTDPHLVEYIKTQIPENLDFDAVYDPTCGDGGLLAGFGDTILKYGQEINEHQLEVARKNLGESFFGICGDTLKNPEYFGGKKFTLILANPPFSIKWEPNAEDERFKKLPVLPPKSKADFAFMAHILHMLADDGIAIVIEFPGVLYRGNSEGKIRKYFVEQNVIEKIIAIPANSFTDTAIPTVGIIFRKNKKDTNIIFEDKETGKSKIVSFEEIKQNDFVLSPNQFLDEDKPKVETSLEQRENWEKSALSGLLRKIEKEIEFSLIAGELEGWGNIFVLKFLEDLENLILKFKK